jgi:hypothetical protein
MSTSPRLHRIQREGSWAVLSITTVLAACALTSQFPVLEVETERDAVLGCAGLEDELLRANALRDAILAEHGDLLASDAVGISTGIMTDPLIGGIATAAALPSQRRRYRQLQVAAGAAEARMIHVLTLREDEACPVAMSQDPARTERQILADLEHLEHRFSDANLTEREYRRERRELLDLVR